MRDHCLDTDLTLIDPETKRTLVINTDKAINELPKEKIFQLASNDLLKLNSKRQHSL